MLQNRRAWTEEDKEEISRLAGKVSPSELARHLDRSEAATRVQAAKLGIKITLGAAGVRGGPKVPVQAPADAVEKVTAPVAIERALSIYQQLQERDQSVLLQARKILTQHIYGLVDQGEGDEQRLTVSGLIHLKAVERDHAIKSAHAGPRQKKRGNVIV
jgi:transposase-like protein